jgi:hypothetical protein
MRSRFPLITGIVLVFGLLLTASAAGAACNPDNALYADNFERLDASWGDPDDNLFVEDGVLVIKVWAFRINLNTNISYETANVCVNTTVIKAPDIANSPMGLIFWLQDWKNFYFARYWADGDVEIGKISNGRRVTLAFFNSPAIKRGVGKANQLEVLLTPKEGTLLINGTEVKRFKGKQPNGGGWNGVMAESPDPKPAAFKFDNFIMNAVPVDSTSASRSSGAGPTVPRALTRPDLVAKPSH